jgi:hypothetical protein
MVDRILKIAVGFGLRWAAGEASAELESDYELTSLGRSGG